METMEDTKNLEVMEDTKDLEIMEKDIIDPKATNQIKEPEQGGYLGSG